MSTSELFRIGPGVTPEGPLSSGRRWLIALRDSSRSSFRLRVLDAATGRPVTDAYAEEVSPEVPEELLRRCRDNPLRVIDPRPVTFRYGNRNLTLRTRNLRTFVSGPEKMGMHSVMPDRVVSDEFLHPTSPPEVLFHKATDTWYRRIRHPSQREETRFVCTRYRGKVYAEPALLTNSNGILVIPLSLGAWSSRTTISVKLRDHLMLMADGETGSGAFPDGLAVALRGDPLENRWETRGEPVKRFSSRVEFTSAPCSTSPVDATVWVVRRIVDAEDLLRADGNLLDNILPQPPGDLSRKGIMVHYNSGLNIEEVVHRKDVPKPGKARVEDTRRLRDAFKSGEDAYMMMTQMALLTLRFANGPSGSLCYHYHLDRQGAICRQRPEDKIAHHAGKSREPGKVKALDTGGVEIGNHTNNEPQASLNKSYIGISLMGNYRQHPYHFTPHQIWYLDRLIENILSRQPDIRWHNILGHDESRTAWNDAHPGNTGDDRHDPGAALPGGMNGLRGRHISSQSPVV